MNRIYVIVGLLCLLGCDRQDAPPPAPATPQSQGQAIPPPPADVVQLPVNNLNSEVHPPYSTVDHFNGPRIADLPENKWVYIRPWSMWLDNKGGHYINGLHDYYMAYQPDFIQILRQGNSFYVSLSGTKFVWTPIEINVSAGSIDTMPVIQIRP